jgi:hypothetical protein
MRTVKPHVSHNTLKIIYYSYFHSIINYGILFGVPLLKVSRSLNCKRGELELWWDIKETNDAENYLCN